MSIHVAITRRVRPGCEAEFLKALHEFQQASFAHGGVLGAGLIAPPEGAGSREYGMLRMFEGEAERAAFYQSELFKAWQERVKPMTEGDAEYQEMKGLEVWFRSKGESPPRWKIAAATLIGVYPTSLFLTSTVGRGVHGWHPLLSSLTIAASMVTLLTWVVMPFVTKILNTWLHRKSPKKKETSV
jgi:antibiotic biosynthesis monooxygenase (ABM) superfamily enzyme